jgi:uncharacterized membrane protein
MRTLLVAIVLLIALVAGLATWIIVSRSGSASSTAMAAAGGAFIAAGGLALGIFNFLLASP